MILLCLSWSDLFIRANQEQLWKSTFLEHYRQQIFSQIVGHIRLLGSFGDWSLCPPPGTCAFAPKICSMNPCRTKGRALSG
jgi:hypothetical protein